MGFSIQELQDTSNTQKQQQAEHNQANNEKQSKINAQLYQYYEELIQHTVEKHNTSADRLALSLILSRGNKPTLTKNRELALLDIDKIISLSSGSMREGDLRMVNMKIASDLSGIKTNLLTYSRPTQMVDQGNELNQGGTFQIFRLVRAAQLHYLHQTRRQLRLDEDQQDHVNNSFTNIQ